MIMRITELMHLAFSSINPTLLNNLHSCFDPLAKIRTLGIVEKRLYQLIGAAIILMLNACQPGHGEREISRLEIIRVLPVEAPYPLEPSGLALHKGRLYTVADKIDPIIFAIEPEDTVARLTEAIVFYLPERGPMDWEGLTVDPDGTFYLISEAKGRMLRVDPDGTASWATGDLRPVGQSMGLFAKENAGFEGLTQLGPAHWLGAVEREPRGLVEWRQSGQNLQVDAFVQNQSPFQHVLSFFRLADYSGLHFDGDRCYALFRNAHLVVALEKVNGQWREAEAWDYRHMETDPRYAYRNQTFGQAEGLVVSGKEVYLIFDNNRGPRMADSSDRRPLFVHARLP
jgi:hypothetical protein